MKPEADPKERVFFSVLAAIAVLVLWVLPARGSFWLDETATFWAIKDGVAATLARPMWWSGQSPLYYLTAWLALAAGGKNEFVLRLPSLLAMLAAAWLLYRLAARLFDRETAGLAALLFICSEPVVFAASDARPYALGLCLLTGSALMLERWLEEDRWSDAAAYAALAALTLYAHYLFATALAVHGVYALSRSRGRQLRALAAAWIAVGLLMAPLVSQLLHFYRTRASHSFSPTPHLGELFAALFPPGFIGPLALGLLVAWLALPAWKICRVAQRPKAALAIAWALAPVLFCFLVSVATETKIFVARYYIAGAPGLALTAAWLVRSAAGAAARRIVAVAAVSGAILVIGALPHGGEDWAGAMRAVREAVRGTGTPVLMASGFIEASDPKALDRPELKEVLFAPLSLYPAAGKVISLPYRLDAESAAYVESVLPPGRFLFIARWQGTTFEPWLRGRTAERGFRAKSLGDFGSVRVLLFERAD